MNDDNRPHRMVLVLELSLVERVDAWRRAREEEMPGLEINRSAALRMLIERGMCADDPVPRKKACNSRELEPE